MKEYSWKEERFWVLVPDCIMVLLAEILVDWIKHAFITRFNELQVDVYKDYTISLAYDMAQTRQKHAFSDHSDLVARRMGFIPLPLGVVMIRVLSNAIHIEGLASFCLLTLALTCLYSFRILTSLVILGKACDLISQHKQDKATLQSPLNVRAASPVQSSMNGKTNSISRDLFKDTATSPVKPVIQLPQRSQTVEVLITDNDKNDIQNNVLTLGTAAIFANSSVDLKNACLNEELLRVEENEADENELVSRSVPNIKEEVDVKECSTENLVCNDNGILKRAESEPSLVISSENDANSLNQIRT